MQLYDFFINELNRLREIIAGKASKRSFDNLNYLQAAKNADQAIPASTQTTITFQTRPYDFLTQFEPATSSFVAKEDGVYLVEGHVYATNVSDGALAMLAVYADRGSGFVSESVFNRNTVTDGPNSHPQVEGQTIIPLKAGQKVRLSYWCEQATTITMSAYTYFKVTKVGA